MTKATLIGHAPILLVRNVVAAAEYWRDRVGFTIPRYWGEPPGFCIPQRDGLSLMLSQAPADHLIVPNWRVVDKMWDVYFWVDDVEAMHAELTARGAMIDYGLGIKDYGVKEFGIQDLDDHDIAFGQVLDA
ncbi:MAG: hypothetical protein R3D25_03420 [Geminicoccaceae bacterium]